MSTMRISVFPFDTERTLGIGDFIMSFILLSKERGVKCKPTSSGVMMEGDKQTLLEMLDELDNASLFSKRAEKVAITIKFDEEFNKSLSHTEIELLNGEITKVDATIARGF